MRGPDLRPVQRRKPKSSVSERSRYSRILRKSLLVFIFAFCENVLMRLISQRALRDFWQAFNDAETALRVWSKAVKCSSWKNFAHVKKTFNTAAQYKKFTIFNIGGNKYRLIAVIHYNTGKLYVRHVMTHKKYDLGKWKTG